MWVQRLFLVLAAALLSGCASLNQVGAEVASFGGWPAGRHPGSYRFERLPSQQVELALQQQLEDAARPALAQAGFRPAAEGEAAAYTVQVAARSQRYERLGMDYPFGWGPWPGFYSRYPYHYWGGPLGWHAMPPQPWYEREVSLLVRDRVSGELLYESRARNDGAMAGGARLLEAMFRAALQDFPQASPTPRRVSVPLDGKAAAR